MITKIISGGQSGAERAALDAAIRLAVPHGGSIPKGRLVEDGPLSGSYCLVEIPTDSIVESAKKNVLDSDGTLIFSRGKLVADERMNQKLAQKHHKPCLHIDLSTKSVSLFAKDIHGWVIENRISVLNISGSKESQTPQIYWETFCVVEAVMLLSLLKAESGACLADYDKEVVYRNIPALNPRTVDEAVDILLRTLDAETMKIFSGRAENELLSYVPTAGALIQNEFKLGEGNDALLRSCREVAGVPDLDVAGASMVIIEALWRILQQTKH